MPQSHDITPRWLDLHETCHYVCLSRKTVMRLVNAGEIVACRVGGNGKWIIDRNSIDAYFVEVMLGKRHKSR